MNQSELYLMMTVTGRERMPDFIKLYRDKGLETHFISLGHGTAPQRYMRVLGLNETEKMVCLTIVTGRKWLEVKKAMSVRLRIEAPGVGIAYIAPLSAVGGKRELMFLTEGQGFEKGAETALKGTEQELLIAICSQGYSEMVMDAARAVGARGGTVIHARGTGQDKAERFLGISLASEKDLILIVAPAEKKIEMMQRIIHDAGPGTKAGAIVFSLPVTDTAGMTLRPQSEELEEGEGDGTEKAQNSTNEE
ncbi:MAG: P-II family nitrogen regulator [Clostridia bacterium]|nr:P-II family nitrogen regulator [Clostridia bacterium]